MQREVQTFALALQFLTRIPVRVNYQDEYMARAPGYFPLVGALVGVISALILWGTQALFGPHVAVALTLMVTTLITGALHEDGLADTADGIWGGKTPQNSLDIMRDSRIGVYGTITLICVFLLRASLLFTLLSGSAMVYPLMIVAQSLSRASMLGVITTSTYLRKDGAGKDLVAKPQLQSSLLGFGSGAVILILLPVSLLLPTLLGLCVAHILARAAYQRHLKGYTGDCLGFVQQISEIGVYLGVLAWL